MVMGAPPPRGCKSIAQGAAQTVGRPERAPAPLPRAGSNAPCPPPNAKFAPAKRRTAPQLAPTPASRETSLPEPAKPAPRAPVRPRRARAATAVTMPRDMAGMGRYPPQPRYQPFAFYTAVRMGDPEMLARIMQVGAGGGGGMRRAGCWGAAARPCPRAAAPAPATLRTAARQRGRRGPVARPLSARHYPALRQPPLLALTPHPPPTSPPPTPPPTPHPPPPTPSPTPISTPRTTAPARRCTLPSPSVSSTWHTTWSTTAPRSTRQGRARAWGRGIRSGLGAYRLAVLQPGPLPAPPPGHASALPGPAPARPPRPTPPLLPPPAPLPPPPPPRSATARAGRRSTARRTSPTSTATWRSTSTCWWAVFAGGLGWFGRFRFGFWWADSASLGGKQRSAA
jgi:hypothetical protein